MTPLTTQAPTCAKCGTLLPGDAPAELCPKCLIIAGLMTEVGADLPPTIDCSPSQVIRASQFPVAQAPALNLSNVPAIPRVFGGYRIIRPLGKGGMGAVYEAEEQSTGRRLALKVLSHSLDSEQARTRFFREGRLAASVNHPNSVYVFGTEEIDGMPVITMELAPGGTLQELVKRKGPLPITEAVDTILQIIAGLEAAAAGGVLHRDVKPSNCFIDGDGAVKVGDFGLSISTLARREANLTTTGAVLGTPAYASPEQLRGDEIDSRSDIYAVGVTLYFLLTGRTPFNADNMVRLLATVLERPAESPRKLRADIPEELSKVILRCLAKQPAQRFKNYEELRMALLPFTSAAPMPAGLGLRFLAGFLDYLLLSAAGMTAMFAFIRRLTGGEMGIRPGGFGWTLFLLPIVILAIPEGLWGITFGKAIMGLRVVGLKRKLPGIFRALARAAIVVCVFFAGIFAMPFLILAAESLATFAIFLPHTCVLLLFVTARRKNGQAALHDLLSGTRVVLRPNWQMRSAAVPEPGPAATTEGTRRVGPYHVLAQLGRSESSELFVGYDARLFRRVWIRQWPAGAAEVSPALRMLTRQGRLRWLGGKRASEENGEQNWDAYEALTGRPLTALLHQPQPWKHVRFWLADLAAELEAAIKDQTLPATLALDRIWITDDGRAKLLDFPAPGSAGNPPDDQEITIPTPAPSPRLPLSDRDAQLFLKQVAMAALEGRPAAGATHDAPRIPLPLHARGLVARIGEFPTFDALMAEFKLIRNMPAEISARRRLMLLTGCVLPAVMIGVVGAIVLGFLMTVAGGLSQRAGGYSEFMQLRLCMDKLHSLRQDHIHDAVARSLEIYIAGRFNNLITDPKTRPNESYSAALTPEQWRMAESIVAAHAPVSKEQLQEATKEVEPLGLDIPPADALRTELAKIANTPGSIFKTVMYATGAWADFVGLPALIAAVLFRGGLLMRGLGLAVVTRDGAPARRWRVLWRAAIVWVPPLLGPAVLIELPTWVGAPLFIAMVCVYAAAALWSVRRPERGVQDFLARTCMVPR